MRGMRDAAEVSGEVGMTEELAEALAALRAFNYENIYLRPSSHEQGDAVIKVLRGLVEFYTDRPNLIPSVSGVLAGSENAVHAAVTYVGGMTDRYAFRMAVAQLGWEPGKLPFGVDVER
jgi:dGTPase